MNKEPLNPLPTQPRLHDVGFADDDETEEFEHGSVLYRASFKEREDTFVSYVGIKIFWIALACIPAYGAGLFLFMLIPLFRYIARKDMQSRKLYVTTESVVYKRAPPVCLPCLGVTRTEKHILLPLVTDVLMEQGCLEARYGIHSLKIENAGQGGGPEARSADVQIQGVHLPRELKKVILWAGSMKRAGRPLTRDMVEHLLLRDGDISMPGGTPGDMLSGGGADTTLLAEKMDTMNETLLRIAELLAKNGPPQATPADLSV
mmetsp:Transcript_19333/g.45227  ORF Transcript_19333/g.45227 Transcript_19333/m.45227 type:complete len:261 (+) Transcript_19333:76-858(+)